MANEEMREQWTKFGGPAWTANRDIFASAYRPFTDALLDAIGPVDGLTVLDVGCGTGGLSKEIVDRGGVVIGVDISETMVAAARQHVPGATFMVADAQVEPLRPHAPAGFDVVISEFGVMFFDDPVAAFANMASATNSGGRLVFQCWRSIEENPSFVNGTHLLQERMPEPSPASVAGSPGPMNFADPALVTSLLSRAGWTDVGVAPVDVTLRFGIDGSDGVEERMAIVRSTSGGRQAFQQLPSLLGDEEWQRLLDDVRAEVEATKVDGVVSLPGATWIVTAVKP